MRPGRPVLHGGGAMPPNGAHRVGKRHDARAWSGERNTNEQVGVALRALLAHPVMHRSVIPST